MIFLALFLSCYWESMIVMCSHCFYSSFRTTSDSTRFVSNKNPSLYWPSKLEILGGSTTCKGYERLFKTQVWHCVKQWHKNRRDDKSLKRLCNHPHLTGKVQKPIVNLFTGLFLHLVLSALKHFPHFYSNFLQ